MKKMTKMNNKIGTLIPIHKFDDKIETLLGNALESVSKQKDKNTIPTIYIVCKNDLVENITNSINSFNDKLKIEFIENVGNTNFQSQINLGAETINEDYFSILEFDDEINSTYYYNMLKYIDSMNDVSIFLPTIIEMNNKREATNFSNQQVWSKQFIGENGTIGYLNFDLLKEYSDFKLCGGVFNRDKFIKIGGLKTNIEITFQYEFLLRMLNNNGKIFTIPKIGYSHMNLREGSLFDYYLKNTTMKDRKFWFDAANKEYYFNNQRDIVLDTLNSNDEK